MDRAAQALIAETNLRKEHEKTLDKLMKSSKDMSAKVDSLQASLQMEQREKKDVIETLRSEREAWNEERKQWKEKVDAKHREMMTAIKHAADDEDKKKLQEMYQTQTVQLESLKVRTQQQINSFSHLH